jgi:hypothetical protein
VLFLYYKITDGNGAYAQFVSHSPFSPPNNVVIPLLKKGNLAANIVSMTKQSGLLLKKAGFYFF